jgi:hypothetical protein
VDLRSRLQLGHYGAAAFTPLTSLLRSRDDPVLVESALAEQLKRIVEVTTDRQKCWDSSVKEAPTPRELRTLLTALTIAGLASGLVGVFVEARQVPVQDRQPAGSALRPAVMGPCG